jgi:hypothetical protein
MARPIAIAKGKLIFAHPDGSGLPRGAKKPKVKCQNREKPHESSPLGFFHAMVVIRGQGELSTISS